MAWKSERYSNEFGVEGVEIEQTLSSSYDAFRGINITGSNASIWGIHNNINSSSFGNGSDSTKRTYVLESENEFNKNNIDGRIPLGMFCFKDVNFESYNFPDGIIPGQEFEILPKRNLVQNGDCAVIKKTFIKTSYYNGPGIYKPVIFQPAGGWKFLPYDGIGKQCLDLDDEVEGETHYQGKTPEEAVPGYSTHFVQNTSNDIPSDYPLEDGSDSTFTGPNADGQTSYAGYLPYVPVKTTGMESDDQLTRQMNAHNDGRYGEDLSELEVYYKELAYPNVIFTYCGFPPNYGNNWQLEAYETIGTDEGNNYLSSKNYGALYWAREDEGENYSGGTSDSDYSPSHNSVAPIATWIRTPFAHSNNRCLVFHHRAKLTEQVVEYYAKSEFPYPQRDINGTLYQGQAGSSTDSEWDTYLNRSGESGTFYHDNQYRTLNQWQTIYRESDNFIVPYSTLTIRFKMYTEENDNQSETEMPAVETALFNPTSNFGDGDAGYVVPRIFVPKGGFNSMLADFTTTSENYQWNRTTERRWSRSAGVGRFQNSRLRKWETFEYHVTLSGEYLKESSGKVKPLGFIVQSGNNFQGRVLLDDFEVYDSGEFTPDVDVRKRISVGNYGKADLTKYYDRKLQPEEYEDTKVPLEAQFYFYPTYTTNQVFDVIRTPMYNDFQKGLFYIYDLDWGDGTPKSFTSEPEQIDEEKALYHTYESSGIFEVTGYMIRMKGNEDGYPTGVHNVKKFKLKICVNSGDAEDFTYFGSEGSAFIPYDKTSPMVGGYSKNSMYYRTIKRQLGIIDVDGLDKNLNVKFKSEGDKLKTELAMLKMDSSLKDEFRLIPAYEPTRTIGRNGGSRINNGIEKFKEEFGKSLGDCDIQIIKYYNAPKSLHELLGFEQQDFSLIGKADEPRYWKNIIPKNYSLTHREDLFLPLDEYGNSHINIYSEQAFPTKNMNLPGNSKYYYPVLPKYGQDGHFIEVKHDNEGNVENGIYPNNHIPFPLNGPITNEFEETDDLLINITSNEVDKNVYLDSSGMNNFGMGISDYKPIFSNRTLQPRKKRGFNKLFSSNLDGAF